MNEDILTSQSQSHLGAHSDSAFDPLVAHPARVYNVWLGGKDHYAADRNAALRVAGCRPQVVAGARANRQFLGRVVRYLAGRQGISQFLDVGTGLPAPGNTHEVAQALDPAARVVYADNDPFVLAARSDPHRRRRPPAPARLPQPGGRDLTVIIDDDGYVALRFWASPGTTPSQITTTLTDAISVITG